MTPEEVNQVLAEADCLYTSEQLNAALDNMADKINHDLAEKNPVVISVMTGAIIPCGHLLTRLTFPLQIDYIHATRYANGTSGGEIEWRVTPRISLQGRTVLIVDDILDEGVTLMEICTYCKQQGASEILTAVLVDKQHDRKNELIADYTGLEIEDRYIFGFGMDYKGYLRNVNGIYAVKGL